MDYEKIVRSTIEDIGYGDSKVDIDPKTCQIDINITKQSPDIAMGVDVGGAGDQGIMFRLCFPRNQKLYAICH